jgi:hypothetical protein
MRLFGHRSRNGANSTTTRYGFSGSMRRRLPGITELTVQASHGSAPPARCFVVPHKMLSKLTAFRIRVASFGSGSLYDITISNYKRGVSSRTAATAREYKNRSLQLNNKIVENEPVEHALKIR